MQIELTPSQYKFFYSKARHPAFVGGWNVGKTIVAIFRAITYSKGIPNNLGVIFRKTARSLHDSTLRDFETYTKLKVDSDRNVLYPNNSMIMFRHLDEIDSINQQNINLGWFYIEQGDELESNREFFMLFGRLRRDIVPDPEFVKLGLPLRSGWVIANAGDHWMLPLWKEGKLQQSVTEEIAELLKQENYGSFSELIESETLAQENRKFVKPDFIASLKVLQQVNEPLYRQYVLNDWTVSIRNIVFPQPLIEHMYSRQALLARHSANAGVAVDPSGEGADDNVFMSGKGGEVLDIYTETIMPPSQKAIKAVEMCKQINGYWIIVDCDGLGIETYTELTKLSDSYLQGIHIIKFHGSAPSEIKIGDRVMYLNMRTEAAFTAQKRGWAGRAGVNFKDTALVEELKADEYEIQRGFLRLIPKEDIKERIGRSPGRADCWKMLQWAFEQNYRDERRGLFDDENKLPAYANTSDEQVDTRRHLPSFAKTDFH
jgi:hypothetical protein